MSLSKREQSKIDEQKSPSKCPDCKWNWDDKFLELCRVHVATYDRDQAEYQAFAQTMERENGKLDNEFRRF